MRERSERSAWGKSPSCIRCPLPVQPHQQGRRLETRGVQVAIHEACAQELEGYGMDVSNAMLRVLDVNRRMRRGVLWT